MPTNEWFTHTEQECVQPYVLLQLTHKEVMHNVTYVFSTERQNIKTL